MNAQRHDRTSRQIAGRLGLPALALGAAPTLLAAQENDFVKSGGDVLRERMQIPWYNAETDALEPIAVREPWNLDLSWLGEPIAWMILAGVVVALALLVVLILRALANREHGQKRPPSSQVDPLLVADRVEALPFLRERKLDDLLGQARYHYEQGNYSEAMIYLFSYELVELDRASLVRLAKGKTNRQYLREALRVRPLGNLLEKTIVTFEDVFFGRRQLDRRGFEACWNQLSEFTNLVTSAQVPA
jgi:hypothetical protein